MADSEGPPPLDPAAPTVGVPDAAALRESEAGFRAVQEASPDGFMLFRSVRAGDRGDVVDFVWVYVNPAAERVVGRPRAELVGRRLLDVMPGNRAEGLFDAYVRVVETGAPWQREFTYRHEGLDHAFRTTAVKVGDGFGVTFSDVTPRHQAEEALRAVAARLRFLAEASRALAASLEQAAVLETTAHLAVPRLADACVIDLVDPEGQARRAIAVHRDPARATVAREYARRWPAGPDNPRSPAAEALRTGAPVHLDLHHAHHAHDAVGAGTDHLAALTDDVEQRQALAALGLTSIAAVPLLAHGRAVGALTLATAGAAAGGSGRRLAAADVSLAEELARRAATALENARLYADARSARAEAEAASRAKSTFLATMSHELRTPLNAVIGYADLLEVGVAGPVTGLQQGYLARVKASGRHLLGLIEDVLDFAKVEAGQLQVARDEARITHSVAASLELVRPQADARGVALDVTCEPPALRYWGDEDRVRQILVNVLSNAVKFTAAGGHVAVSCGVAAAEGPAGALDAGPHPPRHAPPPAAGWAYVRVRDTGIGIPADQLEAVFEPFVQVDRGRRSEYTRTEGGTGLGLAISRQFARLMDGDLTVESVPGAGSSFTLWLPAARRHDADPRARPARLQLGRVLADHTSAVVARLVERLRAEPAVPLAQDASQSALENHVGTFLADFAQQFIILDEPGADLLPLVRDGSELQRLLAEKHGAQRYRLGWDEGALRREFVILYEEIERVVRAYVARTDESRPGGASDARDARPGATPDTSDVPMDDLLALARTFLREAVTVSLVGHRAAAARAGAAA